MVNKEKDNEQRMLRRARYWRVFLRIGAWAVLLLFLYSIVKKGWV